VGDRLNILIVNQVLGPGRFYHSTFNVRHQALTNHYYTYANCITMAAMLPQAAESSFEEKMAALQSTPLFMKSLPSEESDDPVIQALQSLAFEGTPDGG
jgi:hypothetical protein